MKNNLNWYRIGTLLFFFLSFIISLTFKDNYLLIFCGVLLICDNIRDLKESIEEDKNVFYISGNETKVSKIDVTKVKK